MRLKDIPALCADAKSVRGGRSGSAVRFRCCATWIILLLCLIECGLCQERPSGQNSSAPTRVQIDNAESTSKPDDSQIPEANPARPTITNPAHIPPVGYLQFEQGFLQANGSPAGVSRQFSLNEVIRLSVHPRLMLQFATQPFANSHVSEISGSPETPQSDPGDLQVGVQGILYKEKGVSPSVALGYLRRIRSGTAPDIDIGSLAQSATLLVSGDVGGFHYDTNFIFAEQVADSLRRGQYGQTVSVTHDLFAETLHDRLEITGELWHYTQPLVDATRDGRPSLRSNAAGTLWTLGYTVRPNLVLDGGFDHGLTSTSTDWQSFAGFTYLLPHRLWPHTSDRLPTSTHKHVHRR